MRKTSIWLVLALGLSATVIGCKPSYPKCREEKGDLDCMTFFQLCVDGTCMECRSDADCSDHDFCTMNACMREDQRPERARRPGQK